MDTMLPQNRRGRKEGLVKGNRQRLDGLDQLVVFVAEGVEDGFILVDLGEAARVLEEVVVGIVIVDGGNLAGDQIRAI